MFNLKPVNHIGRNVKIGKNVKIWHFTYIGDQAEIGNDVTIGSLTHIDCGVKIGKSVKIEGSVYIPPLTDIGNNVFIGPGAVFTNDPYPPSSKLAGVTVKDGVVIGAHASIKSGVTIGAESVVAMGSVVISDIPPRVVVAGNPAKKIYGVETYYQKKKDWESKL